MLSLFAIDNAIITAIKFYVFDNKIKKLLMIVFIAFGWKGASFWEYSTYAGNNGGLRAKWTLMSRDAADFEKIGSWCR
ncbi:hypothetical protein CHU32_24685 [Superficieibacter electus]|uniref:Uncharacterized protein n=1 Tax=Superficieibacter electus TaxID=2022662 RepID=A0A2P5GI43_9ENTR|nr:hypothetical protein CHU33_21900 [Superficieibacter electus]POP42574.1 hypothetical protein CHU32_24685 [Superficieibacter electus]